MGLFFLLLSSLEGTGVGSRVPSVMSPASPGHPSFRLRLWTCVLLPEECAAPAPASMAGCPEGPRELVFLSTATCEVVEELDGAAWPPDPPVGFSGGPER